VSSPTDGLLDTNVFLHAFTSDSHSAECRSFLAALEHGTQQAWLDPIVLHELSYSVRHYLKQVTPDVIAAYLLGVLSWPGVKGDKDLMIQAVERWRQAPTIGFVDAYLAALAARSDVQIFTKNVRDFAGEGVRVPDPLPS
jgi:predicted nucleic acid-binding protein